MRALLAVLLAASALAGCLQPPRADVQPASLADDVVAAWAGELEASSRYPHPRWLACIVVEDCPEPEVECGGRHCERRVVDVVVPEGFEGRLAVALRWPTDHGLWFLLRVHGPDGALAAKGEYTPLSHLSALALVDAPRTGAYAVEVILAHGKTSTYEVAARLLADAPQEGALLPDLVTLQPTDLRIETPPYLVTAYAGIAPTGTLAPALHAGGIRGCGADEAADGARRCLRFSNAVGNVGAGPLDILLPPGSTTFLQRVWSADGTFKDRRAGPAELHAVHAHFHNAGASLFTVYGHDEATGARGAPVAESRKTGICFADIGLVSIQEGPAEPPAFKGVRCINPAEDKAWRMGLSVGWFDLYDWVVPDQYVEITGVPDGTYELCARANPDAMLLESDPANNEACTVFRLAGDTVEVLSPEPYHKTPTP